SAATGPARRQVARRRGRATGRAQPSCGLRPDLPGALPFLAALALQRLLAFAAARVAVRATKDLATPGAEIAFAHEISLPVGCPLFRSTEHEQPFVLVRGRRHHR